MFTLLPLVLVALVIGSLGSGRQHSAIVFILSTVIIIYFKSKKSPFIPLWRSFKTALHRLAKNLLFWKILTLQCLNFKFILHAKIFHDRRLARSIIWSHSNLNFFTSIFPYFNTLPLHFFQVNLLRRFSGQSSTLFTTRMFSYRWRRSDSMGNKILFLFY